MFHVSGSVHFDLSPLLGVSSGFQLKEKFRDSSCEMRDEYSSLKIKDCVMRHARTHTHTHTHTHIYIYIYIYIYIPVVISDLRKLFL